MADPDRSLLEAWPAAEPAPGFADRVMARLEAEMGSTPVAKARARRWPLALGSAALGAALAVLVLVLWPRPRTGAEPSALAGQQLPSAARTTLHLGARAVAVAEAAASLTWQLSENGDAQVVQKTGSVFYRVERSVQRRFAVQTPHGQVVVVGTCFTVDVGAANTRVLVHEGAVVIERARHAPKRLEAGEQLELGAPRTTIAPTPTPRPLESAPPPADDDSAPKIGHDRATLLEWAKRCQVRGDLPPFEDESPKDERAWREYAQKLGATAAETGALAEAFAEVERGAYQAARSIYEQTLGERDDLEEMSLERLLYEISRTAEYSEQFEVLQHLSAERAGLREPTALEQLGPLERLMREVAALGDRFEGALARRLGAARARALRERNRGWPGTGIDWQGCPSSAQAH